MDEVLRSYQMRLTYIENVHYQTELNVKNGHITMENVEHELMKNFNLQILTWTHQKVVRQLVKRE
jgi:hypothetical protein